MLDAWLCARYKFSYCYYCSRSALCMLQWILNWNLLLYRACALEEQRSRMMFSVRVCVWGCVCVRTITERLLSRNWCNSVFILDIYRGEYFPKSLIFPPPKKKVSKVCKTISLRLLVTRYTSIDTAQNGRHVYCISVSTVMLHMGSKLQFNTRGWQRRVYTQW